jgi:Zn-dependent M28 family amino/carboxypeptidase
VLAVRGTCSFGEKTQAATDAGAAGVIIYNNDTDNPDEELNATLGERIETGPDCDRHLQRRQRPAHRGR